MSSGKDCYLQFRHNFVLAQLNTMNSVLAQLNTMNSVLAQLTLMNVILPQDGVITSMFSRYWQS